MTGSHRRRSLTSEPAAATRRRVASSTPDRTPTSSQPSASQSEPLRDKPSQLCTSAHESPWQQPASGSGRLPLLAPQHAQAFAARWGLNRRSVCGAMFACSASVKNLESVRKLIGETPGRGVTLIEDLLICRASDDKTEPVREFFEAVRAAIRYDIVRREAYAPRIWAT